MTHLETMVIPTIMHHVISSCDVLTDTTQSRMNKQQYSPFLTPNSLIIQPSLCRSQASYPIPSSSHFSFISSRYPYLSEEWPRKVDIPFIWIIYDRFECYIMTIYILYGLAWVDKIGSKIVREAGFRFLYLSLFTGPNLVKITQIGSKMAKTGKNRKSASTLFKLILFTYSQKRDF